MTEVTYTLDSVPEGLPPGLADLACALRGLQLGQGDAALTPAQAVAARGTGWRGGFHERRPGGAVAQVAAASGSPAPEARGSGAANLEIGTLNHRTIEIPEISRGRAIPGQCGGKAITYPDGSVRITVYRQRTPREGEPIKPASSTEPDEGRSARSVARARQVCTHKVRCLDATALWTFTKRGKFRDRDEVWRTWERYNRLVKSWRGRSLRSVAVPELHGDGETWHLHVALAEYIDVGMMRRLWYRALGGTGLETGSETPGSVNIKAARKPRASARGFGRYAAKYIGKGFTQTDAHRRCYAVSRGIEPTRVEFWRSPYDGSVAEFARALMDQLDRGGWGGRCTHVERPYGEFAVVDLPPHPS